jgi:thymidylate synthase
MNQEEHQYLDLMREILSDGSLRMTRGGAGTMSLFGKKMEYSLKDDYLPLFTTKKVFFRGIVEELLWMLRGCTNVRELHDKNVHIWDGHSSREFLDERGLDRLPEFDIGAGYGFQMRHFGATYVDCTTDYKNKGVDQIKDLINGLKNDPYGRRHIVNNWNVSDLNNMTLPPCHVMFQMYVDENGLSCQMYQRSVDVFLGCVFNVTFYSILTKLIAKCVGLKPHKFIHVMGDAHIYTEHIDACKEQLERNPYPFPKLFIDKDINCLEDIEKLEFKDFRLEGYDHHPSIKAKMVV